MAGADLVTSLRQAGVSRGDLVALVISPALDLGLAAGDTSWTVKGVAAEVGRADEELRPRWVLWSGQTAARLVAPGSDWPRAGTSPRRTGCCSAAGGPTPAGPGPGCTAWPPTRCRPTVRSTCSVWTWATPATRWRRTGTCARSGSAAVGRTARSAWHAGPPWPWTSPGSSRRRWPRWTAGRWPCRRPAPSPPPNCSAPNCPRTGCRWTGRSRSRSWPPSLAPGRAARPTPRRGGPHATRRSCGTRPRVPPPTCAARLR